MISMERRSDIEGIPKKEDRTRSLVLVNVLGSTKPNSAVVFLVAFSKDYKHLVDKIYDYLIGADRNVQITTCSNLAGRSERNSLGVLC